MELLVAGNQISSVGLSALAPHLSKAPQLRMLCFGTSSGGNRIGDDGVHVLAQLLRASEAPTPREDEGLSISLKNNPVSAEGIAMYEAALKEGRGVHPPPFSIIFDPLSSVRGRRPAGLALRHAAQTSAPNQPPSPSLPGLPEEEAALEA